MRFSTVFSVLACGAMALAAAVSPDVLVSRSNAGISNALNVLNQKCNGILPQFDTCNNTVCTQALVQDIVTAVNDATAACVNVNGLTSLSLANQVVGVVRNIVVTLDSHNSTCNGQCGNAAVYAQVDVCLSSLLNQLGVSVAGILILVGTLLGNLTTTLGNLNLTSLLGICLSI